MHTHGALFCIPRRALADGQDDRFVRWATEFIQQHAESLLPPTEGTVVESGNPYQV